MYYSEQARPGNLIEQRIIVVRLPQQRVELCKICQFPCVMHYFRRLQVRCCKAGNIALSRLTALQTKWAKGSFPLETNRHPYLTPEVDTGKGANCFLPKGRHKKGRRYSPVDCAFQVIVIARRESE
jgi:hypothetical protein